MRKRKVIYQIKLFIVTILTILQVSVVETAPNKPLLFILFTGVNIICIRLLWQSTLKDERKLKRGATAAVKVHVNKPVEKSSRAA